jgi:hypothetical protein
MTGSVVLLLVLGAQATVVVEDVRVPSQDGGSPSTRREAPSAVLARLGPADEQSVERLAAVFVQERDEQARARAIHDWLVTRLDYLSDRARQTVPVVLARRTANCEGYSRAFQALGRASGLEVALIVGLARDAVGRAQPHSWNAVRLGGAWRLVDVTFDDPRLGGDLAAGDGYRTDYFLVPPDLARLDHLPDDPRWLLGEAPLTRAQFLAQGPERAASRRLGLTVGPTRFEGDVATLQVKSSPDRFLLLRVDGQRCGGVVPGPVAELRCAAKPGEPHHFELFANDADFGLFRTAAEWTTH